MCARLDAILAKTSLRPTALDAICKKLDNLAGASTVRQLCSIQPGAPVALVYGKEPKCRN